jgi:tRNA-binding EMAP/Myf-like protein
MSEFNPQVVLIEKVEKHPFADALSIVTVLGDYPVVTKLDQFKVGDIAGYIPIDSIVPDTDEYYFLSPKAYEKYEENGEIKQRQTGNKYAVGSVPEKYRIIKAKKIRNIYSQGMLVSAPANLNIGDSIAEILGLKKFEEEEEDNIPNAKRMRGGNAASPPKGWSIPYYDINGLRKYVKCLLPDEEVVVSEKIHGCVEYNTIINTLELGDVRIGYLVENKPDIHVKCMNVISKEIEYKKCDEFYDNGPSEDWYEIETVDGEKIEITGNHMVWIPNLECYRKVSDLSISDVFLVI